MSKSKIEIEELSQDLDKIFEIISDLDNENLSLKEISKISNKLKITNKKLKNRYKNLDSKE